MKKNNISGVPVVDQEQLVGIITNRDLRFGDNSNKVESCILAIRAKCTDTMYLKCLMAAGYKQGIFDRGVFIPHGIQIKEGSEFLKNLLREHNNYVKEMKCLAIKGISAAAMFT